VKTPKLLTILEGGDLRSDGRSDEVVQTVEVNLNLLPQLIKGLSAKDEVVRGRTADALEKVARTHHKKLIPYLPMLLEKATLDEVYMVRFHIAMILGYLKVDEAKKKMIVETLFDLLDDDSVFVQSWSIVSLTIIGLEDQTYKEAIIENISPLINSDSIALSKKAENSINILENRMQIPKGWNKKKRK